MITRLSARRISPALQAAREEGRPEKKRLKRSGNSRSVAKAYAEAMRKAAEQGFKENYALLKKLSEM